MSVSFRLDSVENSCHIGRDYRDSTSMHSNRYSHGFVFFKSGSTEYTFKGGKKIIADEGCFLYLPKYSTYSFRKITHGDLYCINLQCNDDVFGDGPPDEKCFKYILKRTSEVESIYKKVVREMYFKKPYYDLRVFSMVYELSSILFNEINFEYSPSGVLERLAPALSYIDEHYTDRNLRISHLASLCDMSENYFRRLFHKKFGKSPIKYINERKIDYATEFLQSGLYSVSEVSSIAGFDDIGYFSRIYKKITGEIPSKNLLK